MEETTKMNDEEVVMNARDSRDYNQKNAFWAEQRSSAVADEFIRLEVQIATIVFAFTSLFVDHFTSADLIGFSTGGIFLMRLTFTSSIFLLLCSLICGLLYLKASEAFWDSMLIQKIIRFKKWNQVPRKTVTFEEALAYEEGTKLGKGHVVSLPTWPWILQTICLAFGVFMLFVLIVIFLFNH